MYDPKLEIQSLTSRIINKSVDPSVILELMVLIREHLEKDRLKEVYPLANMYVNWCLHIRISKSSTGWKIMQNVQSSIIKNYSESPNKLLEEIDTLIGRQKLRIELINIFEAINLEPIFFNDMNWSLTSGAIFRRIVGKPITFSNMKNSKSIENQLERRAGNIQFLNIKQFYFKIDDEHKALYWVAENPAGGKIQGELP